MFLCVFSLSFSVSEVQLEVRPDSRASSLRSSEMSRRQIGGNSTATTAPTSTLTERTLSLTDSSYSGELGTCWIPTKFFILFTFSVLFILIFRSLSVITRSSSYGFSLPKEKRIFLGQILKSIRTEQVIF